MYRNHILSTLITADRDHGIQKNNTDEVQNAHRDLHEPYASATCIKMGLTDKLPNLQASLLQPINPQCFTNIDRDLKP